MITIPDVETWISTTVIDEYDRARFDKNEAAVERITEEHLRLNPFDYAMKPANFDSLLTFWSAEDRDVAARIERDILKSFAILEDVRCRFHVLSASVMSMRSLYASNLPECQRQLRAGIVKERLSEEEQDRWLYQLIERFDRDRFPEVVFQILYEENAVYHQNRPIAELLLACLADLRGLYTVCLAPTEDALKEHLKRNGLQDRLISFTNYRRLAIDVTRRKLNLEAQPLPLLSLEEEDDRPGEL